MAFVVEDGTGLSTATSYVDVAFADVYADSFFSQADYETWSAEGDADKERYLNRASKYIDRTYIFLGEKSSASQALQFPRDSLYDVDEELVSGVPDVVKEAVCLVSQRLMNGVSMDADMDRGGAIIREKIDTIDITYSSGASPYKKFVEIDNLLKASGLIQSNRNSTVNVRLITG
jgi:hypothetical protein